MSLQPQEVAPVPETTARVARLAFRKGNVYMRMRDELGSIYQDELFATLFPRRGQPAEAPWRLALVTVMQFAEGLSDRQAADAVRSRIDWKYALSLELDDPGFDFSVLSEFRDRLISGGLEPQLLDAMLVLFRARGLLKARGRQRTDSTHVLAAVRALNRLELVGETLRAALNSLAIVAPDWLRALAPPQWFERYAERFEEYRLPKGEELRRAYAVEIGQDGFQLLRAVYGATAPRWLREVPAVQTLRQAWIHQYYVEEERVLWRQAGDLPPAGTRFDSPYDPEARYGNKRTTTWSGYKVHVTETCDSDSVHLITHVETTDAPPPDITVTASVHAALAAKDLVPSEHIVDAGYVDGDLLVRSQRDHRIELVGPVRPNVSWQARSEEAYEIAHFTIDWAAQQVTCPQGHTNTCWTPHQDAWGNDVISIKFPHRACRECPVRARCTRAKTEPRHLTLRPQADHELLQRVRQEQQTTEWKERYDQRAGVEGTLSQGIRAFGLREARYIGLQKTHLQHLATAAAINVVRTVRWLEGTPHAQTRTSRFAALAA